MGIIHTVYLSYMALLLVSFLAGVLSVLAPCIIAILPLLVGYSAQSKDLGRAVRVIAGLALSLFIFSLLLKASTLLIAVPDTVWRTVSGVIIIAFGITGLFPALWEKIAGALKLQQISAKGQQRALKKGGVFGDLLLGASIGPIFSACSPTYALIVATILPSSPLTGLLYLVVFIVGLSATMLLVALLGQRITRKLGWSINPHGAFKKVLAIIFICIGLLIVTGLDKTILELSVQRGLFDWQTSLESTFH